MVEQPGYSSFYRNMLPRCSHLRPSPDEVNGMAAGWENFYVIVGSSAGALIGLQFVVITLVAEISITKDVERAGSAFATPTVVHFGAVLLLSALLSVPWGTLAAPAACWGLLGLVGIGYEFIVARRMRIQTAYQPQFEDWLFHALLPLAAYATLMGSAYATRWNAGGALFGVGSASLVLLFVGIHNAWDAVTYHVIVKSAKQEAGRHR
jgi:hypothetical protein